MFVPGIADDVRMTEILTAHSDRLGLGPVVGPCRLVEAQIRHSHRPSSPRCRGWATYTVPIGGAERPPVLLYLRGYPDGTSDRGWSELVASGQARGATHLRSEDLIVWVFPDDPRLTALATLVDAEGIVTRVPTERVPELSGRTVTAGDVELDVVRYQPETSATVRYRIAAGGGENPVVVYAKALDADPTDLGDAAGPVVVPIGESAGAADRPTVGNRLRSAAALDPRRCGRAARCPTRTAPSLRARGGRRRRRAAPLGGARAVQDLLGRRSGRGPQEGGQDGRGTASVPVRGGGHRAT